MRLSPPLHSRTPVSCASVALLHPALAEPRSPLLLLLLCDGVIGAGLTAPLSRWEKRCQDGAGAYQAAAHPQQPLHPASLGCVLPGPFPSHHLIRAGSIHLTLQRKEWLLREFVVEGNFSKSFPFSYYIQTRAVLVSVSWGCRKEHSSLKQQKLSLSVLEARSPKSGGEQGCAPSRVLRTPRRRCLVSSGFWWV